MPSAAGIPRCHPGRSTRGGNRIRRKGAAVLGRSWSGVVCGGCCGCGYGVAVRVVILLGGLASIDRTAYPRFKRVVSARELAEAFTPTPGEVAWARGRTQSDAHLLALAVRLKAYQRLGYFPKLPDIPAVVVDTVRGVLGSPDGVSRRRTRIAPRSGIGSSCVSTWA